MKISAKTVHNVLERGGLRPLVDHCARLERLSLLVAQRLPEPLDRHCRVANLAGDTLVLYSEGPGWTTRLRFFVPRLLEELRDAPEFRRVREIRIRPAPPKPPERAPARPPALPAPVAEHLRIVAPGMPTEALREALLRLAGRAGA